MHDNGQLSYKTFPSLRVSDRPDGWIQVMHLWHKKVIFYLHSSQRIPSGCPWIHFDHPTEVVAASSPLRSYSFPLCSSEVKGEGVLRYYVIVNFKPSVYSLMYSYGDGRMMSYFIQWVIICYYLLFDAQTVSKFGQGKPLQTGLVLLPCSHHPQSPSLLSGVTKCSRFMSYFPCPSPRLSHFHKEP